MRIIPKPFLSGSVEKLPSRKPVPGAKKVGTIVIAYFSFPKYFPLLSRLNPTKILKDIWVFSIELDTFFLSFYLGTWCSRAMGERIIRYSGHSTLKRDSGKMVNFCRPGLLLIVCLWEMAQPLWASAFSSAQRVLLLLYGIGFSIK